MCKFKFKIIQFINSTEQTEKEIIIRAINKLDAFAKIRDMYPSPEYHIKFLETV